ncbi:hypothetical protein CLOM_g1615 [Closterium sp. NIES-68]|nr:hypothetical protein CLOM_g22370 [Closterium sp. NIES-68]GJP42010.1 hypothetical protein CLOM_g1615 [Closterium sp. NIES-68]GJP64966.1 hypothetical protein CLOP_g21898 [Closterium sp. NIES-67]GJP73224.1 hypothetical protein CLOP_g3963 [Closterium sp. NIES-67]
MSGMKDVLAAMHAKYGPVVRLWLNPVRLLISVEDPQQVRNVLMHARERSPLYCRVIEACIGENSACFSTFIQPRARRSFLDYHCHTTLKFQVHEVTCRVAAVTAREWGTLSASGGELDVTQASKDMVVGVLGGSLFGPAFPDSDLRNRLANDLEFFAHSVQDFSSYGFLPAWLPAYRELMRVAEDYRGAIHQLVSGSFAKDVKQPRGHGQGTGQGTSEGSDESERAADSSSGGGDTKGSEAQAEQQQQKQQLEQEQQPQLLRESFLSAMLAERSALGQPVYTQEVAQAEAAALMFHGYLLIPALLKRVLVCLSLHPEVQDRVFREIRAVCGNEAPKDEDLLRLDYLNAVIYEAARTLPVLPMITRAAVNEDLWLSIASSSGSGGSSGSSGGGDESRGWETGGNGSAGGGNGDGVGPEDAGSGSSSSSSFHLVPSGAILALPTYQLQLNPILWGSDAAEFNPDRFIHFRWQGSHQKQQYHDPRSHSFKRDTRTGLGAVGRREGPQRVKEEGVGKQGGVGASPWREKMVPGHDYEFVAPEPGPQFLVFGAGARSCVGQRLSLKIIRAAVAVLLHRFEFSMSPDMPSDFDTRLEFMVLHLHPTPRLKLAMRS